MAIKIRVGRAYGTASPYRTLPYNMRRLTTTCATLNGLARLTLSKPLIPTSVCEVITQPGLLDGSATRGHRCSDILNCEMEPTGLHVFGPPSDPGVVSSRQDELIPGLPVPSPLVQNSDVAFISSWTESSWAASSSTASQNTIAVSSPVAAWPASCHK
jgi:hypothetical protein